MFWLSSVSSFAIGLSIFGGKGCFLFKINQEIKKISEFLKALNNVVKYELLPYHPLGIAKQKAMGKTEITEFSVPTREYMQEVERYAYIR